MADEQKNPEEEQTIDDEAVTPEYADADKEIEELEKIETKTEFEESVTDAIEATTEASEDSPVAEAWDEGVKGVMETAEDVVDSDYEPQAHHYTDEVVLPYFGSIGSMPGGIYTFIFGVLGAITVVEVIITVLIPENAFKIGVLALLSLSKAYLVVMYYMHLKDDDPIFRLAIVLPLIIVLLSVLYLLGVPTGGGLGYN